MKIQYHFSGNAYRHEFGWYLISLPNDISEEIRTNFKSEEEGWGRLKASAKIGNTEWKTAIWYAAKNGCYLLPIKAEVRKKEKLNMDEVLHVIVFI
jgi:hypothetical protein